MKKVDILSEYIYNRRVFLEHEVQQLQSNIRYRSISSVDCLELIIAQERLAMFVETAKDVTNILKLNNGIPP